VQFVPEIAKTVKQLHVYQRSPGWVIPKFERVFSRFERGLLDRFPFIHDLDRFRIFWLYEWVGAAFFSRSWVAWTSRVFTKFLFRLLLLIQVRNPRLRKTLTPDFPIGCKRTLLSNDWLPALARPNVEVVTNSITQVTPDGVVDAAGRERKVDAIIYGTGFEASQFLAPMKIRGRHGQRLDEVWKNGAEAFLGLTVSGFPNFFMQYGPNTNIGGGSIIYMLEAQSRYVVQCIERLRDSSLRYMDVRADVQRAFNEWIREKSRHSSYEGGCHSWYTTADGRNVNNWVDTMTRFAKATREVKLSDYELVSAEIPA
jgi:cation diffusion facilitator CzcD-associated flavoprotein CzcO